MPLRLQLSRASRKAQQGIALTEALIAAILFGMGILGFLGFRMVAVKEVTESRIRTSAGYLASSLVSEMWVNRANLAAYNDPNNTGPGSAWGAAVARELPGSVDLPPIVTVTPATGEVEIVMRWKQKAEMRQYRLVTRVSDP